MCPVPPPPCLSASIFRLTTRSRRSQQLQCEQEEEYITNRLMKRLETLKQEKEDLARQVEFEEEMITNKLSKKLEQVKQEKVNLENLLEQEQASAASPPSPPPTPSARASPHSARLHHAGRSTS